MVPHGVYHAKLESFQVFLKAKNCLVFQVCVYIGIHACSTAVILQMYYILCHPQGAVESIALKTSKERTHLFEEISG